MDVRERALNWSVTGVGASLLVLSLAGWLVDTETPLVDGAERALSIAVALCLVGFGSWLQREHFSSGDIGRVALGAIGGGVLFAGIFGGGLFVLSLEQPLPAELSYLVLNVVAIGMASGGLLTHQYLRLRNQTAGLQRLTVKLADRTASIARQRAQLRAQNERLNTFASFVSHDLRNPLTVAMARLELARETGEEEHLLATERAHARMEQLITDMLDLARHGRTIETPQSVAFESVVESAWDTVHTDGVSLRVDADVHILTDPARLRQLFENLFRNAIDHGGPGLTTVCVGTSEGNGFYVEDDGRGIAADDRDDVFDVQHSTTSEGTGYGLAIVKAIADAHTWTVTVTEGQRGGARFEVVDVTLGAD